MLGSLFGAGKSRGRLPNRVGEHWGQVQNLCRLRILGWGARFKVAPWWREVLIACQATYLALGTVGQAQLPGGMNREAGSLSGGASWGEVRIFLAARSGMAWQARCFRLPRLGP